MRNPLLMRIANQGSAGHGNRSESRVISRLGARATPASGALTGFKSDATLGDFRLEMKSTNTCTLPVDIGWLGKITKEAMQNGQVPALAMSFVTKEGKPRTNYSDWVAVPLWKWKEMVGE